MYIYDVTILGAGSGLQTSASANTEDAYMAIRQATRNAYLQYLFLAGRVAAATSLTSISHRVKRWTTAGSGGTAVTPAPRRRDAPPAASTVADKQSALTPGTVSGSVQIVLSHGVSGPAQWIARDEPSKCVLEAGGADELAFYSSQPGTSALTFEGMAEIVE